MAATPRRQPPARAPRTQADIIELAHEAADAHLRSWSKPRPPPNVNSLNSMRPSCRWPSPCTTRARDRCNLVHHRDCKCKRSSTKLQQPESPRYRAEKYLAQHIDRSPQHTNIIAELPASRRRDHRLPRRPRRSGSTHPQLRRGGGSPRSRFCVLDGRCAPQFILGPAPAQHDPSLQPRWNSAPLPKHTANSTASCACRRPPAPHRRHAVVSSPRAFADEIPPDRCRRAAHPWLAQAAAALRAARDPTGRPPSSAETTWATSSKELAAALQAPTQRRGQQRPRPDPAERHLAVTETEVMAPLFPPPAHRKTPAELATARCRN